MDNGVERRHTPKYLDKDSWCSALRKYQLMVQVSRQSKYTSFVVLPIPTRVAGNVLWWLLLLLLVLALKHLLEELELRCCEGQEKG